MATDYSTFWGPLYFFSFALPRISQDNSLNIFKKQTKYSLELLWKTPRSKTTCFQHLHSPFLHFTYIALMTTFSSPVIDVRNAKWLHLLPAVRTQHPQVDTFEGWSTIKRGKFWLVSQKGARNIEHN